MNDADAIAADLMRAHEARERFEPFAAAGALGGLDDSYAVQDRFVARLIGAHGAAVGYKIGLTSKRMQAMCGIDQPIAGTVLAGRVHQSGVAVSRKAFGRLGLEFEIGVKLGQDLVPTGAPYAAAQVAKAVEGVCAAIELVDDRNADYGSLDVLSLVADNSWNAGAVLSEFRPSWPDLAEVAGVVHESNVEVDRGMGRDVLGHPFEPLTWLANRLAAQGRSLRRGEIVLTGSLVTTRFPPGPAEYRFDLAGIGSVAVSVRD